MAPLHVATQRDENVIYIYRKKGVQLYMLQQNREMQKQFIS